MSFVSPLAVGCGFVEVAAVTGASILGDGDELPMTWRVYFRSAISQVNYVVARIDQWWGISARRQVQAQVEHLRQELRLVVTR